MQISRNIVIDQKVILGIRNHLTTFCRPFNSLYPKQLSYFVCYGWSAQTSPKRWFEKREYDVTNNAHQTQMPPCATEWMELPVKIFCVRHCLPVMTDDITHTGTQGPNLLILYQGWAPVPWFPALNAIIPPQAGRYFTQTASTNGIYWKRLSQKRQGFRDVL